MITHELPLSERCHECSRRSEAATSISPKSCSGPELMRSGCSASISALAASASASSTSTRCTMLGEREERYPTRYPHPGWAEQSPVDWWEALGEATRRLMADLGSPEIDGICAATTASTVVVCRRDGAPLRPALLWMDCRAAAEADATARVPPSGLAYSGGGDAAEWLVPKAMWLAAQRAARSMPRPKIICECLDYVNFMLTGRWVGSRMNATCKWNYDSVAGRFADDLYRRARRARSRRQAAALEIFPVGAPIERLIGAAAAAHLGLPAVRSSRRAGSTRISAWSGADTMAPGELLMIGGTSIVQLFQLARGLAGRRLLGALSACAHRRSLARRGRAGLGRLRAVLAVAATCSGSTTRGLDGALSGGGGAAGRRTRASCRSTISWATARPIATRFCAAPFSAFRSAMTARRSTARRSRASRWRAPMCSSAWASSASSAAAWSRPAATPAIRSG